MNINKYIQNHFGEIKRKIKAVTRNHQNTDDLISDCILSLLEKGPDYTHQLLIDNKELFESDGRKSFSFTQKNDIILSKGLHKFTIRYFQCSDNIGLKTLWSGPGFKKTEIDTSYLYHMVDQNGDVSNP